MGGSQVTVAVCSVGDASDCLPSCLNALGAAGMEDPLLLQGVEGMASLRNRALAECRTPLIAFVDDDVLVEEGWLVTLAAQWAKIPAVFGCLGGPVTAVARPGSPRWMSDELARATSANTPHAEAGEVDAAVQTFSGGNLSFRCAALAGIGGFWPAKGTGRTRDWYSEEHHAQRELARAGWKAYFDPRLAATRIVGPGSGARSIAMGQARAGARRSLVGGSTHREYSQALRAASGALFAGVALKPSLAMERLVRAAGHGGTIAPGLVAGKTLEPASPATQFRHSIPSGTRMRRRRRSMPAIYCFHRVTDVDVPSGLAVTTAAFREQLSSLARTGRASTIEQIAGSTEAANCFAVTFDDGYADNLHLALPILEEFGIPATFFITTAHIKSGDAFWWDQVARLLNAAKSSPRDRGILELTCAGQKRAWAPREAEQLDEVHRHLVSWLQSRLPEEISETVVQLERWVGEAPDVAQDRPMTPEELRRLSGHPLATIGAHTRTHANLRFCEADRLHDELAGARRDLTELTGMETRVVAYPFGVWGADVDSAVTSAAFEEGYETGLLNGGQPTEWDRLAIPRQDPPQANT